MLSVAGACNGNNGAVEVSAAGGTAPYQYVWSHGANGPALFNLAPGDYTVTVTDAASQTAAQTIQVPEIDSLQVQLLLTKALCPGVNNGTATAVTLPAGGNYAYQWSPNLGSGIQITGIPAGTAVCVTVTDQTSGCVGVACGNILAHEQIKVRLDSVQASCFGFSTGSAMATASSGQPPYTFVWSVANPVTNTDTSSTIINLAPGFYTVSVTDNRGCTTIGGASISDTLGPVADFDFTLTDCSSDSDQVTLVLTDQSSVPPPGVLTSWNWLTTWSNGIAQYDTQGSHTLTLAGGESGIIRLVVGSNSGCKDTAELFYTLPVPPQVEIAVSPSDTACPGEPVLLTVTGDTTYTYAWTPTSGLDLSGFPFSAVASGTETATYILTAALDLCVDRDTVTIYRAPGIQIAGAGDSLVTCGDSVLLQIAQPAQFTDVRWYYCDGTPIDPAFLLALPPDTALCLYVTGTDLQFGCFSSDTALFLNARVDVDLQLTPGSACETDTIFAFAAPVQSGGSLTYLWSAQPPDLQIIGNGQPIAGFFGPDGAYQITLIALNDLGCADTLTAPLLILPADTLTPADFLIDLCNGLEATFINNSGYPGVWDFGDNTGSALDSVRHTYDIAGNYIVTFTPYDSCVAPYMAPITVSSDSTLTAGISWMVRACDTENNLVKITLNDNSAVLPPADFESWSWTVIAQNDTLNFSGLGPHILSYPGGAVLDIQLAVRTNTGCVDTADLQITLPFPPVFSIAVSPSDSACAGEPVLLSVSGDTAYTYTWSPTTGLDLSSFPFTALASGQETTTYTLIGGFDLCLDTQSVTIFRGPVIQIAAPGDSLITCADSLSLTIENPAGFTNVQWFFCDGTPFDAALPLALPLDSALCVLVTGADTLFGCVSSDTVILRNTRLDISIATLPGSNCAGDTILLTAVNQHSGDILTYQWTLDNPVVQIFNANQAAAGFSGPSGTYLVTLYVENQFGCTDTLTTTLQIAPVDILEANNFLIDLCAGRQVTLINISGYPGVWSLGDGVTATDDTVVHTYPAAGTYIVRFTPAADCVTDYTQEIQVTDLPKVQADFSVEVTDCLLDAIVRFTDLTQHTDTLVSWAWTFTPPGASSSEQNPILTLPGADSLLAQLVVTDQNGCTDSLRRWITVDIVTDTLVDTLVICPGRAIALNPDFNPDYEYNWTSQPADPGLDSLSGNPLVSPLTPTLYQVTITEGLCSVVQSVYVLPEPGDVIVAVGDTLVCAGSAVVLKVISTTNPNIQWSDSPLFVNILGTDTLLTVTPGSGARWYYVRTADTLCPGIDSVLVRNRQLALDYDPLRIVCDDAPIQLQIGNLNPGDTLTYSWNPDLPPVADPVITPAGNAIYTVTVTNQDGCTEVAAIQVLAANLSVNVSIASSDTLVLGDTAVLVALASGGTGYSYQWSPEVLPPADNDTVRVVPSVSTTYSVTVTDLATGCTAEASTRLTVLEIPCGPPYIFLPTSFSPNGDGFNDFFRARTVNVTELYFFVFNRWGEKMYETEEIQHTGWDGQFGGSPASPDSYGWYIRAVCPGQEVYEAKGNVTLLR